MSGTLASIVVGATVDWFDNIGVPLVINTAFPAFCAAFCFFRAGKPYAKFMENKNQEKEEAFDKA